MKYLTMCLVGVSILSSSALSADEIPKDQAQAVAYFEALMVADMEKANTLVDVPYSLDRVKILRTMEEVDAIHKRIAKTKGKRPVPKFTISKTDEAPKLDTVDFPEYVAFRIVIHDEEHVDIYVSVGESPKVLGFSD